MNSSPKNFSWEEMGGGVQIVCSAEDGGKHHHPEDCPENLFPEVTDPRVVHQ